MSILLSWLTALFLLTLPAFAAGASPSGPPPSVTAMLGIDGVADLDRGEIVAYDVREPTDKTLAAGLAMYVETPPERLIAAIQNGALLAGDPEVIAAGAILPDGGPEALEKFEFTPSDIGEVKALSEVGPGSEFNFSASEIEGFRALGRTLAQASEAEKLKALSRHYRELLWRRADSYRKYGPEAIEPYARAGGSAVDVAAELRLFTEQDAVLLQYSPELRAALLRFPSALPPGAVSTLQWVKRKVDGRPAVILDHQVIQRTGGGAIVAVRDFYVGHSFNSSQMVLAILPYRNGSLVLYSHYTSSDQVAGVGAGLKRAIGRGHLRAVMFERMERLRASAR